MSFLSYVLSPLLALFLILSPATPVLTASAATSNTQSSGGASGLAQGLLIGAGVIGVGVVALHFFSPFFSFGGRVATIDACIGDGGVGEAVTFIPDARLIPLIPPTYIWTPATITKTGIPGDTPEPPHPGQQLVGIARPSAAVCIGLTPPFVHIGGWQMIEVGESPVI